jgi:hypothetical protein
MFNVALGHSEDPSTEDATSDIINQCCMKLGGMVPQAGILFSAINYPLALKKICNVFPNIQLKAVQASGLQEVLEDAVPMLFFNGSSQYTLSVVSGWKPFTNKKLIIFREDDKDEYSRHG